MSLSCGWEVCKPEAYSWSVIGVLPGTVVVQPGSIPAGLISIAFRCCAMPELPAALSSATGLKCLQLDHATAAPRTSGSTAAPLLAPTLERFTGLETLRLWHLQLEDQQSLPALLAGLTRLQHLDLSESPLPGRRAGTVQQLVAAEPSHFPLPGQPHLNRCHRERGAGCPAEPARATQHPGADHLDQRLQLVAAAPQLRSLLVCAPSPLCEENLELLRELPELNNLAVV